MSKIKVLDSFTISKIAAGEVIERPASIVKELVENSLDAGATQIVVETSDAGKSLIRVTDNGEGMSREDLLIAFERHTTSKLESAEDLEHIHTLGFRGEALSSIAAVSTIEVMTRTGFNSSGIQAIIANGVLSNTSSVGTPVGTTMLIKDLFKDVPVRKKFLKSNNAEDGSIGDIMLKLAIGNPKTSFKYIRDSRIVFTTPGKGDIKNNIFQLLGREITDGLVPIQINSEEINVNGFISNNNLYRGNRNHQYTFVNGRYVVDYRLSRLIEQQYSSIIPINRFPIFVLFLELDPEQIDVNIHPTKQEIRFSSDSKVYSIIEESLKHSLKELLKIPEVRNPVQKDKEQASPKLWQLTQPENAYERLSTADENLVVLDYTNEGAGILKEHEETLSNHYKGDSGENYSEIIDFDSLYPLGTLFDTYIIAEDRVNQSMCIIDQHAAHERIMYERFKSEYLNESIAVQQLLTPVIVDLAPGEFKKALDSLEYLNTLGFEAGPFGENSIALRGFPMLFGSPNGSELFLDILDGIENADKGAYETRIDKIMKLSCTSAVKAGDKLDNREIRSLMNQLKSCENPFTCPHGRPTIIRMSRRELERKFLRIL